MKNKTDTRRYIYHTRGVCPPEIHFEINNGRIRELRFVGGGCPGNAQLATRLLDGKPVDEVLDLLPGIDCRNGTSCPDQLLTAIQDAKNNNLDSADSYRIHNDHVPRQKIGFIGAIEGNGPVLERLIENLRKFSVDVLYCCGNLTGNSLQNKDVIRTIRKQQIIAIQGKNDWLFAHGQEHCDTSPLEQKDRDWLLRLPQVLSFQIGEKNGVAFFGDYVQGFPDFSDFDRFALEMNMICDLTSFMQDETVFPALEAMTPQFEADIIVFSQLKKWGYWQIGGKSIISLGPASQNQKLAFGILEFTGQNVDLKIIDAPL